MHPQYMHLEDETHASPDIYSIWNKSKQLVEGEEVLEVLRDFYMELYQEKDRKSPDEIDTFLSRLDLPTLMTSLIEGEITAAEVSSAISKLKPGKAPGSDGLTTAFYQNFLNKLSSILAVIFNAAFEKGSLSDSQKIAIIILLFKKGQWEDVANYQPISLTNLDYKILAYVLTNQLKEYLDVLIYPSQTAYMPGKFLGTNIRKIQDIIDWADSHEQPWVVLFLDYRKAFDSVLHIFLWTTMLRMGTPKNFVDWTMLLYSNACSKI